MIVFSLKKTLSPRSIEINEVFYLFDGELRIHDLGLLDYLLDL